MQNSTAVTITWLHGLDMCTCVHTPSRSRKVCRHCAHPRSGSVTWSSSATFFFPISFFSVTISQANESINYKKTPGTRADQISLQTKKQKGVCVRLRDSRPRPYRFPFTEEKRWQERIPKSPLVNEPPRMDHLVSASSPRSMLLVSLHPLKCSHVVPACGEEEDYF